MFSLHWSSSSYTQLVEYTLAKVGKQDSFDIFENELINLLGGHTVEKLIAANLKGGPYIAAAIMAIGIY